MSFFARIFGQQSGDTISKAIDAVLLGGTGRRRKLEVVGEFYRQPAFRTILGSAAREGVNHTTIAALIPDPKNKHDSNAVEVRIEGRLVGYLSREQAVGYHKMMTSHGYGGRALGNVEARIFGRPLDADNHGGFGVAVYLPESLAKVIGFGER